MGMSNGNIPPAANPASPPMSDVAKAIAKDLNSANARQVGGNHYSGSAYQHWDYASDLRMRHLEGAATKYLARAGNKAGEPREKDLEKAQHYLEKLAELFLEGRISSLAVAQAFAGMQRAPSAITAEFIASSMSGHAFTPRVVAALMVLADWDSEGELKCAIQYVKQELEYERSLPKAATKPPHPLPQPQPVSRS